MNLSLGKLILLSTLLSPIALFSQLDSLKYEFGFNFTEGIYQTYDEFKQNRPSITEYKVIAKKGIFENKPGEYTEIKRIEYTDQFENEVRLTEKDMWGVCHDNQIYVYTEDALQRITKIGALMYIVIAYESHSSGSMASASASAGNSGGSEIIAGRYLIDFENGEFYTFSFKNFLTLLESDKELYDEFNSAKDKKKKQYQTLIYLDKFNDRNPIYFRVNPFYQKY